MSDETKPIEPLTARLRRCAAYTSTSEQSAKSMREAAACITELESELAEMTADRDSWIQQTNQARDAFVERNDKVTELEAALETLKEARRKDHAVHEQVCRQRDELEAQIAAIGTLEIIRIQSQEYEGWEECPSGDMIGDKNSQLNSDGCDYIRASELRTALTPAQKGGNPE